MEILTTTLRNGTIVLAKNYKGMIFPKTFSNRSQAEIAAEKAGAEVRQFGRPFFVCVQQPTEKSL